MPITLDDLRRDERICTVEFAGSTAEITYKPQGYTPEVEDAFQKALENRRSSNGLAQFVAALVIRWDVLGDDGEPYPLDLESLCKLPSRFLTAVTETLNRDIREASDENRKNSGASSPEKKSTHRARTGFR